MSPSAEGSSKRSTLHLLSQWCAVTPTKQLRHRNVPNATSLEHDHVTTPLWTRNTGCHWQRRSRDRRI